MHKTSITKEFKFDVAHHLPGYIGKCSAVHGHSMRLKITVQGPVNEQGFVMDFGDLKKIVNELFIDKYDHQDLNDFFTNPTAEIIANHIFTELSKYLINEKSLTLESVKLWETDTSCVEVSL